MDGGGVTRGWKKAAGLLFASLGWTPPYPVTRVLTGFRCRKKKALFFLGFDVFQERSFSWLQQAEQARQEAELLAQNLSERCGSHLTEIDAFANEISSLSSSPYDPQCLMYGTVREAV